MRRVAEFMKKDDKCINGQKVDQRVKNMRYGFFKMPYNGCGVIAVYNALTLKGKNVAIEEIVKKAEETMGVMWFGGLFGTRPKMISGLLEGLEVGYDKYTRNFEDKIESGEIYIISVWNGKHIWNGIHTVAFLCGKDKSITVYNRYSDSVRPSEYKTDGAKTGFELFMEENGKGIVLYRIK